MINKHPRTKQKNIVMPREEYISEHNRLIEILKFGTPKQRLEEAKRQEEEMKEYLS